MNYAAIKNCDIANGPGVRVSLFVSGCRHHCKDCFNPETWDFACGEPFDEAVMDKLLALLAPGYIRGITYLGGEPFEPENQRALLEAEGVAFLDDGTMIVVENGRRFIGQAVVVTVSTVLQTSAGRMIFAKARENAAG